MTQEYKKCFKCKWVKPLEDFYKHPAMADGRLNKCKECNKKDVRENRKAKIDYYRAYDRARGNRLPPGYDNEYAKRFPIKRKAQHMVSNAVRDGGLIRAKKCEQCGSEDYIHGHHDDYLKPLDVRWLCAGCHHSWHAQNGEAKNANANPELVGGEPKPRKLNKDQVLQIRRRLKSIAPGGKKALALEFNVSPSTINDIQNRRSWADI